MAFLLKEMKIKQNLEQTHLKRSQYNIYFGLPLHILATTHIIPKTSVT